MTNPLRTKKPVSLYSLHRRRAYTRDTTSFHPPFTGQTSSGSQLLTAINPVRYNRRNLSQPYPCGKRPSPALCGTASPSPGIRYDAQYCCPLARCAARKPSSASSRPIPLSSQSLRCPPGRQDCRNVLCKASTTRTLFVTAFVILVNNSLTHRWHGCQRRVRQLAIYPCDLL